MTKTDSAYEPSRLLYPQPPRDSELKRSDEMDKGRYKPDPTPWKNEPDLLLGAKDEPYPVQEPQPPPPTFPNTIGRELGEFLTRRQAAEYIRTVLGRPMSFSTASKLAALREFATPALWWGRRPLYTRDDLRAWAESRSQPTKQRSERASVPENAASTPLPTPKT
jgi:hypothetical protein